MGSPERFSKISGLACARQPGSADPHSAPYLLNPNPCLVNFFFNFISFSLKERLREIFHPLLHSSIACSRWEWVRLKVKIRTSGPISPRVGRPISLLPLGVGSSKKLASGVSQNLNTQLWVMASQMAD